MKIAVCGVWHQGAVIAACLGDVGHVVVGADGDHAIISGLAEGRAPLFEPGLNDLLKQTLASGRLQFSTDYAVAVDGADCVFVSFDTPVDENDEIDLSGIVACVENFAPALSDSTGVIVTAQVPIGTCDELAAIIRKHRPNWSGAIGYIPENLRLGQAIERFRKPPLPVLGTNHEELFLQVSEIFAPFEQDWQQVSLRSGEMIKHALNGFLAVSICYANEIGRLCDEYGADGYRVADILRLEPRIGTKAMLRPGLGFAGGTLARDMQTLRRLGRESGLKTELLDGAWNSNTAQNSLLLRKLEKQFGDLSNRTVAVLGLTYKPDTSTLRRSAALSFIKDLLEAGVQVRAHDPMANITEVKERIGNHVYDTAELAINGADALVLMTPWQHYKDLDFTMVKNSMKGTYVLDSASFWNAQTVSENGLKFDDIGRGRQYYMS